MLVEIWQNGYDLEKLYQNPAKRTELVKEKIDLTNQNQKQILCLMIYQIMEIIYRNDAETALNKFDIADEIFDLDDFASKIHQRD